MKEMIEKLKTTWTAFGGLTKEEQEFLREHHLDVGIVRGGGGVHEVGNLSKFNFCDFYIYRLRPDFQLPEPEIKPPEGYRIVGIGERRKKAYPIDCELMYSGGSEYERSHNIYGWRDERFRFAVPSDYVFAEDRKEPVKERWFFNTETMNILAANHCPRPEYIEITAEQKAYLERKPEPKTGFEWVLKVPEMGEFWMHDFITVGAMQTLAFLKRERINGIRWTLVPVKVDPRFVEYEIRNVDGFWLCTVDHICYVAELSDLPNIVGFTGLILFRYANGSEQWRYALTDRNVDGSPATPIKARFYITEELV